MIRKELLIAISLSALLLGGCVDSSTGASAKADMEGGKSPKVEAPKKEVKAPAQEEKKAEAPKKEEAKAPVAEEPKKETNATAPATEEKKAEEPKKEATVNTTVCAGCHGANFEKKAMGVSKIVKDLSKDDIIKALKGYKDGSYGGSMKGIMKAQASALDDATIEAIANKVGK